MCNAIRLVAGIKPAVGDLLQQCGKSVGAAMSPA